LDIQKEPGSISKAIALLGQTDEQSAQLLWDRFFKRLCRFAQGKIYKRHRRWLDPEDIAGSAMFALMDGLKHGRFHSVEDRDQLWQMLVMITARKAANKAEFLDREKRGGKRTRGDSALNGQGLDNLSEYIDETDDPAKLVEIEMTCRELLVALPDDSYREIALMRMAGHSNQEIGKTLGCSTRTIDRKLNAIREVWNDLDLNE
jgi:RNA polymerase sigma factor (sigma-70 family)